MTTDSIDRVQFEDLVNGMGESENTLELKVLIPNLAWADGHLAVYSTCL